ncbi:MAG: amidase family protein, partial [Acholeplasmataceae bacterium]|nr:amidase family protein [Acholeplasmataceae bacterium]
MIKEMIHLLETGQTNSVELVKKSISIHEKWIHKNALANISPQALYLAAQRDEERKNKMIRGPLHGIPLVIKDNILYRDGTPTTASAYSLNDLIPPCDATIITKLIDAGAIILGNANLSEF